MLWFFWTLQVLLQRWSLTCHCIYSLTPRQGNRERPGSGLYFKIFEENTIFNEHPVCPSVTLVVCSQHVKTFSNLFLCLPDVREWFAVVSGVVGLGATAPTAAASPALSPPLRRSSFPPFLTPDRRTSMITKKLKKDILNVFLFLIPANMF